MKIISVTSSVLSRVMQIYKAPQTKLFSPPLYWVVARISQMDLDLETISRSVDGLGHFRQRIMLFFLYESKLNIVYVYTIF